jgi:hypothetical protein
MSKSDMAVRLSETGYNGIRGHGQATEAHMRTLMMFNSIALDGCFTSGSGTDNDDMSWAHTQDEEWNRFTSENASGETEFIFGRKTYEMMAGFWAADAACSMA